ncbi:hypothetical protein PR048_006107 [Dryococelus australis]|uniref:Uncharacterized protein n=1 Tax=Dryococelus australis TaxID=614101 RepID=A0ABQ9IA19_9NEOP|nr:hypothetical protein PR048_006107 [Dryococelus australis]
MRHIVGEQELVFPGLIRPEYPQADGNLKTERIRHFGDCYLFPSSGSDTQESENTRATEEETGRTRHSQVGIVPDDAAGRWVFSGIYRFPRPLILALHRIQLTSPSSALKTTMLKAARISSLTHFHSTRKSMNYDNALRERYSGRSQRNTWSEVFCRRAIRTRRTLKMGMPPRISLRQHEQGRRKRAIPKKTLRPTPSSGTIPTCENPGVTRPGIKPGSPWWEASSLTAQPPPPQGRVRMHAAQSHISVF